ncbi:MAG: MBL fold metallo-hydrolase [Promethearchaeota archaeon]
MTILKYAGQISPNLYMLDTMQFNLSHITTAFCYYDGQQALLMDVGTSDNVSEIIRSLRKNNIPLEEVKGITTTHYHFDHAGGVSRLYKKIIKKNPDFKIYTTKFTRDKIQNAVSHIKGATSTFGEFVGTMRPIPEPQVENAFHLLDGDMQIPLDFDTGVTIKLIPTPGHSPDHVSPAIYGNSKQYPDFVFAGEAAGTFYAETRPITNTKFTWKVSIDLLKHRQNLLEFVIMVQFPERTLFNAIWWHINSM